MGKNVKEVVREKDQMYKIKAQDAITLKNVIQGIIEYQLLKHQNLNICISLLLLRYIFFTLFLWILQETTSVFPLLVLL